MDFHFLVAGLTIVLIDLLLGGDNAVVIAMAVRALPPRQRQVGIMAGAALAVVLRVSLTFFAAELIQSRYIQLGGGLVILWIAVRLFHDADPAHAGKASANFWRAIGYIVLADVTMSVDNILAIAAASKGNLYLLIFGLGLSIPFVIFTSTLLSKLMDRYPFIVYIGAGILGRVGGEMIMTDPAVAHAFEPTAAWRYGVEIFCAVMVVLVGFLWSRRQHDGAATESGKS